MKTRWYAALAVLPWLFVAGTALPQARPPSQRTGPIYITGSGSTGDVSAMSVTPDGTGTAALLSSVVAGMPIQPEDYRQPGDPDDTLSFQRAADKAATLGRFVQGRPGKTYTLCKAVAISPPGIILRGATVKPCANFVIPRVSAVNQNTGATISLPQQPLNSLFYNKNWSASAPTDDGWSFLGGTLDVRGTNLENADTGGGEFHAIKARMARNVNIDGVTCWSTGDCTAIQASDVTRVANSRAYYFSNAGFDFWEGSTNAVAENNVAVCAARRPNGSGGTLGPDAGVMFTATSTNYESKTGANLASRNNKISGGCNAGLFVNVLSAGSKLINISSDNDTIDAGLYPQMIGAVIEGNVEGGSISNMVLKNGDGPAALLVRPDIIATSSGNTTSGKPALLNIVGLRVYNWTTDPGNLSPVVLYGFGHTVTGLSLFGGKNNTSTTTENNSISVSGTINPTTSAFGPYNCMGGCTTPGVVTVLGSSPGTTVH